MVAVATWLLGGDVLYSLQDETFDRDAGLRSIPARFGTRGALRISAASHVATVAALVGCGLLLHRGPAFAAAVATVGGLLVFEHRLVHRRGLEAVDRAFFDVNAWVSLAFFALVLADELARRFLVG
jgi:4-hydroxybenzoate polyprenyltransferase